MDNTDWIIKSSNNNPNCSDGFINTIMKWYGEHPIVHIPKKDEPTIIPLSSSVGFSKN